MPDYPGIVWILLFFCVILQHRTNKCLIQDIFNGLILHSTQYKRAADHIEKVIVVGAGTAGMHCLFLENLICDIQLSCTAYDIAADCYKHGIGFVTPD